MLVFDENERGPSNSLRYQFEAVSQLPEDEQTVVKEVLDSLIIKYQTRRWDTTKPGHTLFPLGHHAWLAP